MSSEKEIEGKAFRDWFATQKTYNSLGAMERALNITTDYLHLIKNGKRRALNPDLRQKLQAATGLKEFSALDVSTKASAQTSMTEKSMNRDVNVSEDKIQEEESNEVSPIQKQLEAIEPLIRDIKDLGIKANQILTQLSEVKIAQETSTTPLFRNSETRAKSVLQLLLALSAELEFFKTCTENDRRIFKKIVSGQDVGYLTTLLRALYDEDKFQRWLLFSTYTMKGKER